MQDASLSDAAAPPSPKRRQMLEAAADLFIAQGYGAVSMDTIARGAGVSKATLYAHFSSKDQLFATIIEDACRTNILDETLLPEPQTAIGEALDAVARRILHFILQPRSLAIHRVVVTESTRFPELGRAFYASGPARFRAFLAGWLTEQSRSGRLHIADPAVAADQFVALLRGGLYVRATLGLPHSEAEIDAAVRAAVSTFLAAFGPAAGGSAQRGP